MLEQAWIIPVIPFASFVGILLFGKRLPRKGSELGIAAVGASFVLAVIANVQWFQHVDDAGHAGEHAGIEPITRGWTWFQTGGIKIAAGTLVDGPAVMMLFVVTLVSLLVHVYSTD
ncbi:MAG TPA: hypothetical protein VE575_09335, partial [Acidimicrobiales bacterium]|nr:hypothetical protein [Acidimicrobiales bacterium]